MVQSDDNNHICMGGSPFCISKYRNYSLIAYWKRLHVDLVSCSLVSSFCIEKNLIFSLGSTTKCSQTDLGSPSCWAYITDIFDVRKIIFLPSWSVSSCCCWLVGCCRKHLGKYQAALWANKWSLLTVKSGPLSFLRCRPEKKFE